MKRWTPAFDWLVAGIIGVGILVAACSTTPETLAKQQLSVAAACLTYGKSLGELAQYRPRLDATAVAIVESVRATLNPVCQAATPPSATEAATTAVMSGLGQLSTVIAVAKGV